MKQRKWQGIKRFRFVRWSRNAAAAFHSIGLEVSIGRLKANVQERIAPKSDAQKTIFIAHHQELLDDECERDCEHLDEYNGLSLNTLQELLLISSPIAIDAASFI